jgi:hypothetical protein
LWQQVLKRTLFLTSLPHTVQENHMKHMTVVLVALLLCSAFAFGQTIQKGDFTASVGSEGWSLAAGSGERVYIEFVTFDKPFEAPPTVVVSLAGIDATADDKGGLRVHMMVDKITKAGCIVKIKTWGSSKVGAVFGTWMAFSK